MKNLSTQVYGELTVIKLDHVNYYKSARNEQTKPYWLCKCSCGKYKIIRGEHLVSGRTLSCGANIHTNRGSHFRKHGLTNTPEYRSWLRMRSRVIRPDELHKKYYYHVNMDERWNNFEIFLSDMGNKPTPKHELDRIDPFGHYVKENCRWATRSEQMYNTRRQYKLI